MVVGRHYFLRSIPLSSSAPSYCRPALTMTSSAARNMATSSFGVELLLLILFFRYLITSDRFSYSSLLLLLYFDYLSHDLHSIEYPAGLCVLFLVESAFHTLILLFCVLIVELLATGVPAGLVVILYSSLNTSCDLIWYFGSTITSWSHLTFENTPDRRDWPFRPDILHISLEHLELQRAKSTIGSSSYLQHWHTPHTHPDSSYPRSTPVQHRGTSAGLIATFLLRILLFYTSYTTSNLENRVDDGPRNLSRFHGAERPRIPPLPISRRRRAWTTPRYGQRGHRRGISPNRRRARHRHI